MTTDTIAAVATALSNSGIGIIRVSGNDAVPIVNTLFKNKKRQPLLEKMNAEYVRLYGHPLDIRDNLSIDNFLYIIQHAQLVITNDTGPMHFAISFHTPVIAIFGPTPPNYAVDKNRSPSLIAMRAKAVCPGSNKCTIFNSMDKERAEEIRQICNKKNQICTDMITVESVTCVAQRVLSASCFSIS